MGGCGPSRRPASDGSPYVSPPFQAVPTNLARYGLSQVVNHLLGNGEGWEWGARPRGARTPLTSSPPSLATPTPYDFLIDGALVRGPLDAALRARGTSAESVVELEYIIAVAPPAPAPPCPADDWVLALAPAPSGGLIAGCADGVVRAWTGDGLRAGDGAAAVAAPAHAGGAAAVACLPSARLLISAGRDGVVRVSTLPACAGGESDAGAVAGVGRAHADSVASLAAAPTAPAFASGGWDGVVRLWAVDADALAAGAGGGAPKKRRGAAADAAAAAEPAALAPSSTLEGHSQAVTALAWPSATTLVSAGLDGAARRWDAATGAALDVLHAGAALLAVAAPPGSPAVAAFGGAGGAVRVWDSRSPAAGAAPGAADLGTHAAWVSAVAWHPSSIHHLASASHDGSVRVWDCRARGAPLAALAAHDGKALAVAWADDGLLTSGGEDGKVRAWSVVGVV